MNSGTAMPNLRTEFSAASAPSFRAPVPQRIGPYEIIRQLGVGGMAEVYRVRPKGSPAPQLIIKCIRPELAKKAEFVLALMNEARLLAMLCHPNIVRILDFGESNGRHYIALEFLDGLSLAAVMGRARKARKPLPIALVAFIAREVCRGLAAVHSLHDSAGRPCGIIHRDVTPSNVMTTTTGQVKLLDFGIAKMAGQSSSTRPGQIRGKSGYLAPEQILGGQVDKRVDLFALGVIVYEMLTLQPLFGGAGGDLAALRRTLDAPIVAPSRVRRDVPSTLNAVVLRALSRKPDLRYASADALASDFDGVLRLTGFSLPDIVQILADLRELPRA
jgi:eukaryotic-like serine/threonine-protein kinase